MTDASISESPGRPITVDEMYGDWDLDPVLEALDRSLSPRPSSSLLDLVGDAGAGPGDTVLDIGGREGQHALAMAEKYGCRVVAVDLVQANIDRGLELVKDHDCAYMVELKQGDITAIPADDETFKVVFSRDMLGHVQNLHQALSECHRVLKPGGAMIIYEVFGTPLLYPEEADQLCRDLATVPERMDADDMESTIAAVGFDIERREILGSEHVEASQETGTGPNHLVEISRMRRAKEALIEEVGEIPYRVMYGNALYSIYRFIGKLESRSYLLRKAGD